VSRRDDGVIGRPIHRHVEEALRHEEFIARWRPRFELFEMVMTPIVALLGALLVLAMASSFFVAMASHGGHL
jgi:hypothetical protein